MKNKEDLIKRVIDETGETHEVVETIIDSFLQGIVDELVNGEEVKIVRFGKFNVKSRVERNIVNPSTKEIMRLPTLSTVAFKPSQNLKDLFNK